VLVCSYISLVCSYISLSCVLVLPSAEQCCKIVEVVFGGAEVGWGAGAGKERLDGVGLQIFDVRECCDWDLIARRTAVMSVVECVYLYIHTRTYTYIYIYIHVFIRRSIEE